MESLAVGFASYSLLELVLRLLRVGVWVRSVLPLTLREAQGVLFELQVPYHIAVSSLLDTAAFGDLVTRF